MARFAYAAYRRSGEAERGEIDAADRTAALDALAAKGLTVYCLGPAGPGDAGAGTPWWRREVRLFGNGYAPEAFESFLASLALTMQAGAPMTEALRTARDDIADQTLSRAVDEALVAIEDGASLTDALEGAGYPAPARALALLRVGEEANRLPEVAGRAAEMLAREIAFRREIRAAMTYPVILLAASLLVILGLIFFLAPAMAPVFSAVRVEPPAAIRAMLGARWFLTEHWPALLGLLLLGGFLARRAGASARAAFSRAALNLPGFGPVLRARESAQSMLTLSLMLEGGAPLLSALSAARESCRAAPYRALYDGAIEEVRGGGEVSTILGESPLIPVEARRLLRLGEASNRLPELAGAAANLLEEKLRRRLKEFLQLLTPAMTLIIGLIVGAIVFSTLSAILEINALAF